MSVLILSPMGMIFNGLEHYYRLGIVNAGGTLVKMYKMYFCRIQSVLRIQTLAVVGYLSFSLLSANAATWYVDNTATGTNNGTSWPNAWTSLSSASGSSVQAGDTVYISGGPSGSSQTYNVGSGWSPKSGTSGGRITYQIGQDTNHNGTAIFGGGSGYVLANIPSYVNIVGDAGDGQRHFQCSGFGAIMPAGNISYQRIAYFSFNSMAGTVGGGNCVDGGTVTDWEFDHNYIYNNGVNADGVLHADTFSGAGYDQNLIHDNVICSPRAVGQSNLGTDCMQFSGSGYSIYNNTLISYQTSSWNTSEGQHSDGWQTGGGSYVKIYNNYIYGFDNTGLYGGCWGNAVSGGSHIFEHVRIYNNIIDAGGWNAAGCIDIAADQGAGSTFSDIMVLNNAVHQPAGSQGAGIGFATGDGQGTWTLNVCSNNIIVNGNNYAIQDQGATTQVSIGNNAIITEAQAATMFRSYSINSTNNDWHLAVSATPMIGQGANFYSFFTTDKDGNPRPASGAWDIGPCVYNTSGGGGGGGSSNNPAISISSTSLDFGMVPTNTSTNKVIIVRNTGGGLLSGSAIVSAPFQIVSGGTYSLGSNQTQTVTVQFKPASAGTFNQTVTFTGGNGASASVAGLAYVVQPALTFSSANGTILAPFAVVNMVSLAGTTNYISQSTTTGLSGSGEAVYGFNITNAGNYAVSAQVNAPSTAANSFYVNIDGQPTDPTMIWDPPITSGFTNLLVSWRGSGTDTNNQFVPEIFSLSAGAHQLIVRGREGGAQLANITIAPYAVLIAPTGLRVLNP